MHQFIRHLNHIYFPISSDAYRLLYKWPPSVLSCLFIKDHLKKQKGNSMLFGLKKIIDNASIITKTSKSPLTII